jgi:hypothetical protein
MKASNERTEHPPPHKQKVLPSLLELVWLPLVCGLSGEGFGQDIHFGGLTEGVRRR